jgi:hypothetical protein
MITLSTVEDSLLYLFTFIESILKYDTLNVVHKNLFGLGNVINSAIIDQYNNQIPDIALAVP